MHVMKMIKSTVLNVSITHALNTTTHFKQPLSFLLPLSIFWGESFLLRKTRYHHYHQESYFQLQLYDSAGSFHCARPAIHKLKTLIPVGTQLFSCRRKTYKSFCAVQLLNGFFFPWNLCVWETSVIKE